mgnify:CR=1 FL=1
MKKEIKRVKRERVYQGTIVDVYKDYMEFSNGNHEVWDYIHHKGAAAVIPVMDDGRLLMVRQYRNALDRLHWNFRQEGWTKRMNRDETVQQEN